MTATTNKRSFYFTLVVCAVIGAVDAALIRSALFEGNEKPLVFGVAFDLMIVVPLLVYLFIVRKGNKSVMILPPLLLLGFAVLTFLVPQSGEETLAWIKYVLIPVELSFITYGIIKLTMAVRESKRQHSAGSSALEWLSGGLTGVFGRGIGSSLLLHELSIYYYALFSWRKKPYEPSGYSAFYMHEQSGRLIVVLLFAKLLIIEGAIFHILLMQWSHLAAWILTAGNAYAIFMMVADYRAMRLNPVLVGEDGLRAQFGLQLSAWICWDEIESVERVNGEGVKLTKEERGRSFISFSPDPNVLIRLRGEREVAPVYGRRRAVTRIYIYVDQPEPFLSACRDREVAD
ncbi:hypothetical protein ACFQZE_21130 [Paenibacillus sp. GCM10027627]|uniref:hypothetical protein n=1 Tax=unclassified Paenibacillus TaxID=185978 RepID=UPI0036459F49